MKRIHKLKTNIGSFQQIAFGDKTFELTKFDRDYREGDKFLLEETDEKTNEYTGNSLLVEVSKVSTDKKEVYGLLEGYCVLAIKSKSKEGKVYVSHNETGKKGIIKFNDYLKLVLMDNLYKRKVYWSGKKNGRYTPIADLKFLFVKYELDQIEE